MKYWALDYVTDVDCWLVLNDQLYATEKDARAALAALPDPSCVEVNWYTILDLQDEVYGGPVEIDSNLHIKQL